jgi:hypothetical protein
VRQPEDEILHGIERNDSGGQIPRLDQRSGSTYDKDGESTILGPALSRARTIEIL